MTDARPASAAATSSAWGSPPAPPRSPPPAAGRAGRCSAAPRGASRLNDWVGEKLLLSPHRLAPEYPIPQRTPDAAFPAYSITRAAAAARDPARLGAGGGRPGAQAHAAHPGDAPGPAAGHLHRQAPLRRGLVGDRAPGPACRCPSVMALVEPTAEARYLRFDTFDAGYFNGWDLESALHPQTILAYAFNDRPLRRRTARRCGSTRRSSSATS